MTAFSILTNRKRAIIALVHSVVFLMIAVRGLSSAPMTGLLHEVHIPASSIAIAAIYLVVTSILGILFHFSRWIRERLYFGFCTASAGTGLVRSVIGDGGWHVGPQLRVLLLACGVITGLVIVRSFEIRDLPSESSPESAT